MDNQISSNQSWRWTDYSPPMLLNLQGFLTILRMASLCVAFTIDKIYSGKNQLEPKLSFEKETELYHSCGVTLNGQNWIIGGKHQKRQACNFSDKTNAQRLISDKST